MLRDDDQGKWNYLVQTEAKHRLLVRYTGAWLGILHGFKQLVVVDAFAGRGRYTSDEPGSPLLLRDLAAQAAQTRGIDVDLFYIERQANNADALSAELATLPTIERVREHGPICASFESAAPSIVTDVRHTGRPSFWFIDPFGFSGFPISLIDTILRLPHSEVLITLMVRDINRFLDEPHHQKADSELFGLDEEDLRRVLDRVKTSRIREKALVELYAERISELAPRGRPRFLSHMRMAAGSAHITVYYLVHVTSIPKGKREIKKAIWHVTSGRREFRGVDDPSVTGQLELLPADEFHLDFDRLQALLSTAPHKCSDG